jgi:hypothetical protein
MVKPIWFLASAVLLVFSSISNAQSTYNQKMESEANSYCDPVLAQATNRVMGCTLPLNFVTVAYGRASTVNAKQPATRANACSIAMGEAKNFASMNPRKRLVGSVSDCICSKDRLTAGTPSRGPDWECEIYSRYEGVNSASRNGITK